MPALEGSIIYGVQIRESANDGSDFSNAATDYRILFLGEDGLLHVKDSSGTVSSPYTGGGLSSGTSNPGSPANGDLFYRTDLDLMIRYRSSGTRWVCVCPHTQNIAHQDAVTPVSATGSVRAAYPVALTTEILVESTSLGAFVNTTNDGTKYWTMAMPNGTTASTQSLAPNTAHKITSTTQLAVALSSWAADCAVTKVSTPGTMYFTAAFTYRYIVT